MKLKKFIIFSCLAFLTTGVTPAHHQGGGPVHSELGRGARPQKASGQHKLVKCSDHLKLRHGSVSRIGSHVVFSCNNGYHLKGKSVGE